LVPRPDAEKAFPFRCELEHAPLSTASYAAISYVWGQQDEERAPVDVDYSIKNEAGDDVWIGSYSATIGENLAWALFHLRKRDEELRLWADAICINQEDNVEKACQVQLMGHIFKKATTTYVWLGPTSGNWDGNGIHVLDVISYIGDRARQTKCACLDILYNKCFNYFYIATE
jgi:hypothetical protein